MPQWMMQLKLLLQLGKGALLVKLDLRPAYRQVPVHPQDYQLLELIG